MLEPVDHRDHRDHMSDAKKRFERLPMEALCHRCVRMGWSFTPHKSKDGAGYCSQTQDFHVPADSGTMSYIEVKIVDVFGKL